MILRRLPIVAIALLIAAAPASQPTTRPTTRRSITETIEKLKIGEMTRADVVQIMGEPERELRESDGKAMYYESTRYVVRCFVGADGKLTTVDQRARY